MEHKTSRKRAVVTLAGGATAIIEEYFVCTCCKDGGTGRRVICHSESLRGILPPKTKYGYDIEIEAGYLQYAENKQMLEIRGIFKAAYGISITQSQIHELGIRFLKHMVANHYMSAPLLSKHFESGCVYHVDATCEAGRGMELTIMEGWTGIVLGAWKIPTENEEIIKRHLLSTVNAFGEPLAFVSDLGNGMMSAISGTIEELRLSSRQLVCHMHFLKAVGGSILQDDYKALRSQFRKLKTLAGLNRFVKELGDIIKPQAVAMRDFVEQWQSSGSLTEPADYLQSMAVLRALAQWVILYTKDSSGEGFPFALPHVHLFNRCTVGLCSLQPLLLNGSLNEKTIKQAKRLERILETPLFSKKLQKTVQGLKETSAAFTELREIMRLEGTDVYKQDKDKMNQLSHEDVAHLKDQSSRFRSVISERIKSGAANAAQLRAYRIILTYFSKYERFLFNHFVTCNDASGNETVKLIERSNNIIERHYRDQKHQIRRRTGTKNLGHVYEHLFPAAAMIVNLKNPIYQQTILQNKSRYGFAELFSSIDCSRGYLDTPMFQDDFELIGGRLPKADKRIVGKHSFTEMISSLAIEFCNSLKLKYV